MASDGRGKAGAFALADRSGGGALFGHSTASILLRAVSSNAFSCQATMSSCARGASLLILSAGGGVNRRDR